MVLIKQINNEPGRGPSKFLAPYRSFRLRNILFHQHEGVFIAIFDELRAANFEFRPQGYQQPTL